MKMSVAIENADCFARKDEAREHRMLSPAPRNRIDLALILELSILFFVPLDILLNLSAL